MDNEFIPVAASSYLAERGTPKNAIELKQHRGLFFRTPTGPTPWLCQSDGQWQDVSAAPVVISNNGKWLGEQAVAGVGIMMAPRWSVQDFLNSGELQELSIEPTIKISQNPNLAIYLLYQKQQYLVPKVKVAVDFLVSRVSGA
jgi:DNA-binding transcriptional LysR family regulator